MHLNKQTFLQADGSRLALFTETPSDFSSVCPQSLFFSVRFSLFFIRALVLLDGSINPVQVDSRIPSSLV